MFQYFFPLFVTRRTADTELLTKRNAILACIKEYGWSGNVAHAHCEAIYIMYERNKLGTGRSKMRYYRHSKFRQNLQTQLFHIARKQLPIGDVSAALFKDEYDYSFLWPAAPVSFHNPLPVAEVQKAKDDPMCFPGHKKGQLLDKRACFLCRKEGRYTLGTVRKDSPNGERRKLYPRTIYGCRTCNVPLCKVYNCWVKYHTGEFAGVYDYIDPINWLNTWVWLWLPWRTIYHMYNSFARLFWLIVSNCSCKCKFFISFLCILVMLFWKGLRRGPGAKK